MKNPNEINSYYQGLCDFAIISKTDREGRIIEVNDKFCEVSGYSKDELLGQYHGIVNSGFHNEHFFKQMWDTILSGKSWRGEIRNKNKSGDYYWVDTIISPVKNDKNEILEFVSIRFDISHSKQLEESLKASNQKYQNQLEFINGVRNNASHAIITTTVDGTVTSFNRKAEEILGYTSEDIVGKKTPEIWHDLDEVVQRSEEFSKKLGEEVQPGFDTFICHSRLGLKNEFEWTYIHKDGARIPVMLTITALEDDGDIKGFIGLAYDLSEKKFLESKINESNDILALALSAGEIGVWDWYLEDNSVKFDHGWAKMLGLEIEGLPMQLSTWESRVHPDDLEQCRDDIKAYVDGKTEIYQNIHRMRHADGHWVYILDKGKFSEWDKDGNPIRFTGIHIDITENENIKRKLSLFYDNSPFGFAFCDMEGNLLDVNKKYKDILGYDLEELKELSYWDITPRKYEEQEAAQLESLEKTGKYGPYAKEYIHKDGHHIPVELNGFIVENYDGQSGIWSIVEDVSKKKEVQDELEKQRKLATHNAKLASIGTLAGGVGHEINNPLAIVKGYLQNLRNKHKDKESIPYDEANRYLTKIEKAADRITRIVQGLRSFSRMDDDTKTTFDAIEAVRDTFSLVEEIYNQNQIELSFNCSNCNDGSVLVHGNIGKFQQVLMNLLSNARDAVKDKPLKTIAVNAKITDDRVQISVEDNGVGIAKEIHSKVFDPFFTTKEINEGTGIGLSLVHTYVTEMDGELTFTSEENEGTTFVLDLPLQNIEHQADVLGSGATVIPLRALIVDDEIDIRELLVEILEGIGFETTAVENGKLAYEKYQDSPESYDLIISDLKMPIMDGYTLLQKLRSHSSGHSPKFIAITGGVNNRELEDPNNVIHALSDGLIFKPFDIDKVIQLIEELTNAADKDTAA